MLYLARFDYSNKRVQIYAILLDGYAERRYNVRKQLSGLKYTVFRAVNGRRLTNFDITVREKIVRNNCTGRPLKVGEIGCLLSHFLVWKEFANSAIPYALIFEDDLKIVGSLRELIPALLSFGDFDLLYLGHGFEDKNGTIVHKVQNYEIRRSIKPLCTHAYLVSNNGAKNLVRFLLNHPTCVPVDCVLNDAYWSGLLSSFCVFPQIVKQIGFKTTVWLKE